MRFSFISTMSGMPWGGSEELWSQTAVSLKNNSHDVFASTVFWPQPSPKIEALKRQGIGLSAHSIRHVRWAGRIWHKISGGSARDYEKLSQHRPDLVVISQGFNMDGLDCMNFCRNAALPFAVIVQCNSELWWPDDETGRDLARAYRAARKVFCVSQSNLDLLERQIGERLPNGVVVRNPYNVSPNDGPIAWPTETNVWRLACVGRLSPPAKGQDLLFQVLTRPEWRARPVEINLYGMGPSKLNLQRLAESLQLKMVHFRGHVDDVTTIWAENHMLVLPSRFEGLPLALVEAMWCGRPAIVTDVAGNAELCSDGKTGFVAAAPAVGLLAETMETAWNHRHEWSKMGLAARVRVEQLVPKDPIGNFCQLLLTTAATSPQ